MNVLLMILNGQSLRYAIVPTSKLKGYNYREWDQNIVDDNFPTESVIDSEIKSVFMRLGLEPGLPHAKQDLRAYLFKKPDFKEVRFLLRIGWVNATATETLRPIEERVEERHGQAVA